MRRAALLACVLAACGGGGVLSGDAPSGQLAVRSDLHGTWRMNPTACVSGERLSFFGVDLIEDGDASTLVRIVLDPLAGYRVAMNVPGEDIALIVDASDCETFDVDVTRTNTRVNEFWAVEGHAVLACHHPDIDIDADLQFAGCH